MAAVANNPKFAKKAGVPQSVGAEFLKADKGRKFKEGGEMKESKAMVKKEIGFMKKAGAPRSMIKHEESEMKGMKKMAGGGITTAKMGTVKTAAPSRDGMATKGKTKGTMVKMAASKPLGMKRGGKTC
jgi:DNA uptake protein ComE-like DNA-binding protein